ncbi:MAG: AI-2E family transporter [Deltaproteobacteria bacterium]|nr:AI-2E family transporter [Candidatus Zymogenaceae bacterium]
MNEQQATQSENIELLVQNKGPGMLNVSLLVGLAVLLTIIMRSLAIILKPFFIAVFISYLIYPGVTYLAKRKIPKFLAYILVFFFIFGIIYILGALISVNINDFIDRIPEYEVKFTKLLTQTGEFLQKYSILQRLGLEDEVSLTEFDIFQYISVSKLTGYLGSSIGSFFDILGNTLVVLFFMIFILLEIERFPARIEYAYGDRAEKAFEVTEAINSSVRKYLGVKTLVSLGTGGLYALILGVAGVDFWILWGFLGFILNYIPYIGSYIATIFPTLLALIQFGPLAAVVLLALMLTVQTIMGSIIEPKVLGRELNLSPILVLIALAFWGWVWGFVGMFLSIPITASIKIIMDHVEETRVVARLMSDVREVPPETEDDADKVISLRGLRESLNKDIFSFRKKDDADKSDV